MKQGQAWKGKKPNRRRRRIVHGASDQEPTMNFVSVTCCLDVFLTLCLCHCFVVMDVPMSLRRMTIVAIRMTKNDAAPISSLNPGSSASFASMPHSPWIISYVEAERHGDLATVANGATFSYGALTDKGRIHEDDPWLKMGGRRFKNSQDYSQVSENFSSSNFTFPSFSPNFLLFRFSCNACC